MEFEIHRNDRATEVRLKGQMFYSDHHAFKDVMAAFETPDTDRVVFNLNDLRDIDSSGLGMLIIAREEAEKRGVAFSLLHPRHEVKRVMDLAKFDEVFDVTP